MKTKMSVPKDWSPILTGEDRGRALAKIREINDAVSDPVNWENQKGLEGSLSSGAAGVALFLTHYNALFNTGQNAPIIEAALQRSYELIDIRGRHTFGTGTAGILWVWSFLTKKGYIEIDDISDMGLESILQNEYYSLTEQGQLDFLTGSGGMLLCFMELKKSISAAHFEKLAKAFVAEGVTTGDYFFWNNPFRISSPHQLSPSQGMSCKVRLMCRLLREFPQLTFLEPVIEKCVNYLLSVSFKEDEFRAELTRTTEERLQWCSGELSNAVMLIYAGKVLDRKQWKDDGLEMLLKTTSLRDPVKQNIHDATLSNGSAGIAHIYSRMYHETGNDLLKEAAKFWFDETLNFSRFPNGLAGYRTAIGHHRYVNLSCFLNGVSGTGLALISAVSELQPEWDECLLLS